MRLTSVLLEMILQGRFCLASQFPREALCIVTEWNTDNKCIGTEELRRADRHGLHSTVHTSFSQTAFRHLTGDEDSLKEIRDNYIFFKACEGGLDTFLEEVLRINQTLRGRVVISTLQMYPIIPRSLSPVTSGLTGSVKNWYYSIFPFFFFFNYKA